MGAVRRPGFRHSLAIVGQEPQDRNAYGAKFPPHIHHTATLEALCQVDAGTRRPTYVGPEAWLMKLAHVGHDAWVGPGVELTPGCVVSGFVVLSGWNRVGVGSVFKPYVAVGVHARIGAGSVVLCDVPPYEVWAGNPARRLSSSPVWEEGEAWRQEVEALTGSIPSAVS